MILHTNSIQYVKCKLQGLDIIDTGIDTFWARGYICVTIGKVREKNSCIYRAAGNSSVGR